MDPMKLKGVTVRKVVWTPEKVKPNDEIDLPKVVLTLEIEDPSTTQVKELLDFASTGRSVWTISDMQREMAGMGLS